jgi:predicted flavoprotein YhiN
MAAIHAADGRRRVLLLERTKDGGRKILISGGGRCNVLPSQLSPKQYVTESSPNTLRKMLLSWPLAQQRAFFEGRLGLRLELEAETGKLFPVTHRARDVRDGLVGLAEDAGVETRFAATVVGLAPGGDGLPGGVPGEPWRDGGSSDARWVVELEGGARIVARSVIMATGGLSVPNTGSDGTGLRLARKLGHLLHDTYPALTPLTATPAVHAHLAGVSLDVRLTAPLKRGRFETAGGFLFTHRGYSGPSVLDISHIAVRARAVGNRQQILVQWTDRDAVAWDALLTAGGAVQVGTVLRRELPQRLADALLSEAKVEAERPLAQLRRPERSRLVEALASYDLPWTGDEGYRKAEVTGGGVALGEVDSRTLESRRAAGLYLCGEMLDAFGPIGGYNFAWAWATGRAAGLAAAAA